MDETTLLVRTGWTAEERSRVARVRRYLPRRRWTVAVAIFGLVLMLTSFLVAAGLPRALNAYAAARDIKPQLSQIQALLNSANSKDQTVLPTVETHLVALQHDIRSLEADLPPAGLVSGISASGTAIHGLAMADDFISAAVLAVQGGVIVEPHLKAIKHTLSEQPTAPGQPALTPLTLAQLTSATSDLNAAVALVQRGVAERPYVHDSDLYRLHLAKLVPYLHLLDTYSPLLPQAVADLKIVEPKLPDLLGFTKPSNVLFFDLDSDELRATGGLQGNYAIASMSKAKLTQGFSMRDIYTLDCPNGCGNRQIPARFDWFPLSNHDYGLRDGNLDPDYPSTARFDEQLLSAEGGPATVGVVSLTPQLIQRILKVLGPLYVSQFNTTVTADDLRAKVHYYHIEGYFGAVPHGIGAAFHTTDQKAFDAALSQDLIKTLARLHPAELLKLAAIIPPAIAAHDINIYMNDPTLEALVVKYGLDGAVQTPPGDSMEIVDTNIGGTYANADVVEQANDTVTLDASGTATHTLAITYTYPVVRHIYDAHYADEVGWFYTDYARVLVPAGAQALSIRGCATTPSTEAHRTVLGCTFTIDRGASTTLHFSWSVPAATTRSGSTATYSLHVQRQSGARLTFGASIRPPTGTSLRTVAAPLTSAQGAATLSGPLTYDLPLSLTYGR